MLSVCLEKYTLLSSSKASKKIKKKSAAHDLSKIILPDKERLRIVTELVNTMKSNLQLCDEALGNFFVFFVFLNRFSYNCLLYFRCMANAVLPR